ncbi:MAG: translation initiation factor IF-2 [Patescibacteria group bacterium]|nr:translation initiation factor IF-2 [Patescibacteria group bacterium]
MNITELARILKVPTQELRDKLPLIGFDIGQKAIKVDNVTAQRIIREWPILIKQLAAKELAAKKTEAVSAISTQEKPEIKIPKFITVRDFSIITGSPINKILSELMKNGIFSSLNEKIDFDTAAIIGADLGLNIIPAEESEAKAEADADILKQVLSQENQTDLMARAPIIVVMGHVDHGKTKLLDAIRQTDVVAGEAGGITQHIGAYQIIHQNKPITFIDTPGHEAFTAMRNRGAKIADIAILVVAADDGVKPQTIEAFRIIEAAKLPFIVAINKIDKPEANLDMVKRELGEQLNIIPEDWGGKTVCLPISAKNNTGINELLDMLLLTAEMEAKNIQANPGSSASGTIIESHIDRGQGPVATVLIQNGTLSVGDPMIFNGLFYGKVRALEDYTGKNVKEAKPAMPVKIIGLKMAPVIGDILQIGQGEKIKASKIFSRTGETAKPAEEKKAAADVKNINLLIKSDVLGSGEAIEGSLAKIDQEEVKINIIAKGLGNITEGDIARAEGSKAKILGFNVKMTPQAQRLAREKNVEVKSYKVIYELINDLKAEVDSLIESKMVRADLGRMKVLAIFRTEKSSQIVGGRIIDGKVEANSLIEVMRDKQIMAEGRLAKLQIAKQDVSVVDVNQECGINFEGKPVIQVDDILQFYKMEKEKK